MNTGSATLKYVTNFLPVKALLLRWSVLTIACIAMALCSTPLHGQTSLGQIAGSVVDATNSAVAGATITATELQTNQPHTAVSDESGFYIITNLPIGDYLVEIKSTGFRGEKRSGITITADAKITSNFQLQIGTVTSQVEVTAVQGEQINTTSGELAHVIDTKQVENLPLNGRNYTQLMTLIPGAVVTNPDIFSITTGLNSTNQVVNGNRSDSANLTVDGAFNQASGSNGSLINNVGPDFIQEVKIETSNFSAEFGRTSGPAFNIVTKGGSNRFHGSAFEFVRNNIFDARPYFSAVKTHLVYNDFGYSIGGPIFRDRLFFFGGEEFKRLRQQQAPTTFSAPSTDMLKGHFANLTTTSNGVTTPVILHFPGTSTPIPNNDVSSLITPDGKAIANVYTTMEALGAFTDSVAGATTLPANNLLISPSNPLNFREDLVRLDFKINSKNSIFGRWISDHNSLIDPYGTFVSGGTLPTVPTTRNRPGQSYLVSETWDITPSIINQATFNFSFVSQHIPPYGVNYLRSTYGFQYTKLFANSGEYPNGIPSVGISNFSGFSGPYFQLNSPTTDIQAGDTVSIIKGNHLIKFGGVYIRNRVDQNGRPNYNGNLNFNPSGNANSTGLALADALTGNFNSYQEANADPVGHFRFSQPEVFAQDNWKILRRLSIEYGVRWQDVLPLYAQGNNYGNFDPAYYNPATAITVLTTGKVTPGSGNPFDGLVRTAAPIPADQVARVPNINTAAYSQIPAVASRGLYQMHGAFGPRVGFAYAPDDKTAIRGGFGSFYYRPEGNVGFSQVNIQPYLQNLEFDQANLNNITAGTPNNTGLQAGISAIDPNLKAPYVLQYSFGVQRELPFGLLMETSYVGNVGHHLLRNPNINTPNIVQVAAGAAQSPAVNANFYNPFKGFSSIGQYKSDSNTNYNALQVYISKRRGALTGTIGYTYAKGLGDSSSNGGDLANWQSLNYNYGELGIDRRHAFIATAVYQLPTFAGKNMFLREGAGGLQVTVVARVQSGPYQSIQANAPTLGTRRANYLGGNMYLTDNRHTLANHQAQWLNPAAFGTAPAASFGTAGVGSVILPGLEQGDVTLSKVFYLPRESQFKLQADAFNVLNKTNFSGLDSNASDGGFGRLNGAYPPRQMQFAAKFIF
jgi:Carboxypeptidase regulatory-like domain